MSVNHRPAKAAVKHRKAGLALLMERPTLRLARELIARYNANECGMRAQALAFVAVGSIVPLLLCGLAALSFLIHDPLQVVGYLHSAVTGLLPSEEATRVADDLIRQSNVVETARVLMHGKWWAIILGIGGLVWAALSLVVSATTPMNNAWEVQETRGYIYLRFVCLRALVYTAVLFVLSFLPAYGPGFIKNQHVPWIVAHQPLHMGIRAGFELIAWATDICMFVVLYRALPNTRISWKSAFFGGTIAGICWELLKRAFATYVKYAGAASSAYGALGGAFVLISWVYYSCSVLLIGPILCKMYHEHCERGHVALKASATTGKAQARQKKDPLQP